MFSTSLPCLSDGNILGQCFDMKVFESFNLLQLINFEKKRRKRSLITHKKRTSLLKSTHHHRFCEKGRCVQERRRRGDDDGSLLHQDDQHLLVFRREFSFERALGRAFVRPEEFERESESGNVVSLRLLQRGEKTQNARRAAAQVLRVAFGYHQTRSFGERTAAGRCELYTTRGENTERFVRRIAQHRVELAKGRVDYKYRRVDTVR